MIDQCADLVTRMTVLTLIQLLGMMFSRMLRYLEPLCLAGDLLIPGSDTTSLASAISRGYVENGRK